MVRSLAVTSTAAMLLLSSPRDARADPAPELRKPDSRWEPFLDLRAGIGYRDNVLLSHYQPVGSGYFYSQIDASLIRARPDHTPWEVSVSYEDTRFFEANEVKKEQSLLTLFEGHQALGESFRVGFTAQHYYMDQVYDASITESELGVVQARGHSLAIRPIVTWSFHPAAFLEVEPGAERQWFEEPLDDDWEAGTEVRLGRRYGRDSKLSLQGAWRERLYDTRQETDSAGQGIPGSSLRFTVGEVGAHWKHYWDSAKAWSTRTRLGYSVNRDNGSGYYDFNRLLGAEEIAYRRNGWEATAQVKVLSYDYLRQAVSGAAGEIKERRLTFASVRLERDLGKRWHTFVEYELELSDSNEPSEAYHANNVRVGLRWEL